VKSPKLYFCDTGLACFLAGIRSVNDLQQSPLLGPMFETHVLHQITSHFANQALPTDVYFYRDHQGHEVDFVLPAGNKLILIECKTASTPELPTGLRHFTKQLGQHASVQQVIITPERSHRPLANSAVMIDNCIDLHTLQEA